MMRSGQRMINITILFSLGVFGLLMQHGCSGAQLLPLVVNTWPFVNATAAAWQSLQAKIGAEDSLVKGCSVCEVEQCDGSVGYGNHPDETGETTLDAMIMDGDTMSVGAVGDLRRVKNAIGVAQAVMKYSDHTLLVGESATKFALEMGFKEESLSTNSSCVEYSQWMKSNCQPNFRKNVRPDPSSNCGPYSPLGSHFSESQYSRKWHPEINKHNHDTIGMLIVDEQEHVWAGTSTNGANHKIPGRVGDSPIMGAGAYANSQVGAAAATGDGDIMMRFLPSFKAVTLMELGASPQEAAVKAITPIAQYFPTYAGAIVVADKFGRYGAACHGFNQFSYSVASPEFEKVKVLTVKCS